MTLWKGNHQNSQRWRSNNKISNDEIKKLILKKEYKKITKSN